MEGWCSVTGGFVARVEVGSCRPNIGTLDSEAEGRSREVAGFIRDVDLGGYSIAGEGESESG